MPDIDPASSRAPSITAPVEWPRRLSELLRGRRDEILDAWGADVRRHPVTNRRDPPVLADIAPALLDAIIDRAQDGDNRSPPGPAALPHPREGHLELSQVITEYLVLRGAIRRQIELLVVEPSLARSLDLVDRIVDEEVTSFAEHYAHELRETATATATRWRFLADATAALASSLNYDDTLQRVAELAVPVLADWCLVDLVDDTGGLRRVSVGHRDPKRVAQVREWTRRHPTGTAGARHVLDVIRNGTPEVCEDISDAQLVQAARDAEDLAVLRSLGLESYVIVPLVARERRLGAITLVSASPERRYTDDDVEVAAELARRAALAVDNARLYLDAQQAIHGRDQVLAVVSHDLRNPLTAINMLVSLARDATTDPSVSRNLELVLQSVDRMRRLINDMLDTSAIQAGRLALERTTVDAAPLVVDAVDAQRAIAVDRGIAVEHDAAPGIRVVCDPMRIAQVLANLIGNALKFCRPGDTVVARVRAGGDRATFVIGDTGPGIAADDLPHIFEPYWSKANQRARGSGLGLYICKGIIEAHRGRIWAESSPGRGTQIAFTLERARA